MDCVLAANEGVAGLIPSQGTCLGCGPDPQLEPYKRQGSSVGWSVVIPICQDCGFDPWSGHTQESAMGEDRYKATKW